MTDTDAAQAAENNGLNEDVTNEASGRGGKFGRVGRMFGEVDTVQLVIAVLIGLFLVVFVRGITLGVTGEDRYRLPDEIESVSPIPDAVQAQPGEAIIVDLVTGYTGVLVVDGRELETIDISLIQKEPGSQLTLPAVTIFEPGNSTLRFIPADDSLVPPFSPGVHTVVVRYWSVVEGPRSATTYTWSFKVS